MTPVPPVSRARRRLGWWLVIVGGVLTGACVLSEWRGLIWWSEIRGLGTNPGQWFVMGSCGELRVGWRGTGGFFTRAIMPRGFTGFRAQGSLFCPPRRVWMAWRYAEPQVVAYVLPVTPIAATVLGVGLVALAVRRIPPGSCRGCGYDLSGLEEGEPCPECGTLQSRCASSTSQPG